MKLKFVVNGMTCAACSARVEKVAASVAGVHKAEVNLLKGSMVIEADSDSVIFAVCKAIKEAGYQATPESGKLNSEPPQSDDLKEMKSRIIWSAVFLVLLMYFTMGSMAGLPGTHWSMLPENGMMFALMQLLLTLPVVYLNRIYYIRGLKALWHRSPNMDSLIAVGSLAALVYSVVEMFRMAYALGHNQALVGNGVTGHLYFESAAMILTLITVGKFLETRAKGKTGDAIRALMDLSPKTATLRRDGEEIFVPVEEVKVGDIVIARSGDTIAVDGTVIEGRCAIDQSALTGESIPVEKSVGDSVAASTLNTEGYIVFRADKVGEDTTLSQVIRMVEEAGGSKAPIARLADTISGIFVPVVMGIAAITFVVWMLLGSGIEQALSNAISVLVISCPCALGLATPVAIMVGTGRGASRGVLYKNAESLENLHRVDTVVFDKTGTLTSGKPSVTDVIPSCADKEKLLSIAAALESRSEHPFAKAILDYCSDIHCPEVEEFQTIPGMGISARIEGTLYYGGNDRLMERIGVSVPPFDSLKSEGKTPLYFASEDGMYLGAVAAADILKSSSSQIVEKLYTMGLDVIMLTGDNKSTAESIARGCGIKTVIADVMPSDKAGAIRELMDNGKRVLMVGDGINDAPALVTADVGMAIGTGTDVAIESADIVLMNGAVERVADAIALSRATIKNIRQNLFWAFFYNSLGIPIAAGVLAPYFTMSPMLGAAAMSMSSVFVVTNALRLRFFNFDKKDKIIMEEISMETVIKVEGMMCKHCKARVEEVCKAVAGAASAVVDLEKKTVTVTGNAAPEALKKAITEAGYEVIG